jgi:excinuclease ABC subunit B
MRLEMFAAAENLDFEKAARMRDELKKLEAVAGVTKSDNAAPVVFDPYAGTKRKSTRPRGTAKVPSSRNNRRYKVR